jgi:hypothetical protein
VITGAYRDLFAATAAAAGALTGLLFVAMSVASRQALVQGPRVTRQIRGSAALLAFTNALAVSLFGLVPGINVGYPAVIVAMIGILFTAAAIRSILSSRAGPAHIRGQTGLIMILLLICFTELIAGVVVLGNPASQTSVQVIDYALVTSLLVGIGRAWEFIGERDTGILASLGILARHAASPQAADHGNGGTAADDISSSSSGRDSPLADGPDDPAASDDEPG